MLNIYEHHSKNKQCFFHVNEYEGVSVLYTAEIFPEVLT